MLLGERPFFFFIIIWVPTVRVMTGRWALLLVLWVHECELKWDTGGLECKCVYKEKWMKWNISEYIKSINLVLFYGDKQPGNNFSSQWHHFSAACSLRLVGCQAGGRAGYEVCKSGIWAACLSPQFQLTATRLSPTISFHWISFFPLFNSNNMDPVLLRQQLLSPWL